MTAAASPTRGPGRVGHAPVVARHVPLDHPHPAPRPTDPTTADHADALDALAGAHRGPFARLRSAQGHHHERRLARRLAARDPQALAELHALTGRAAFSAIVGIVRDRGHAEDVQQQVYAEVWRRADQFDASRGTLLSWVLTIARSRAIDHVRRRKEQPVPDEALAALGGAAEDRAFGDVVERAYVAHALAKLPSQERDLLRMRFWEGLSQVEIAERTGQPLGTVKSRMLSGLRSLKLALEAEGSA